MVGPIFLSFCLGVGPVANKATWALKISPKCLELSCSVEAMTIL